MTPPPPTPAPAHPAPSAPRGEGAWRAALLLVALAAAAVHTLHYRAKWIDDAYITFRAARNFAGGDGLVVNPGEPVEAITNLAWALAVAPATGGDPLQAARFLSVLAVGLTLWALHRWARAQHLGAAQTAVVLATPVLLPWLPYWSMQGLETAAVTAAITVAWTRADTERRRVRAGLPTRPAAALGLALAPWLRPDSALLVAVLGLWLGLDALYRAEPRWRRHVQRSAAVVVGAGLALVLAKAVLYGALLPQTFHAKTAPFPWYNGAQYLVSAAVVPWPPLGLAAAAATLWGTARAARGDARGVPALVVLVYASICVVTNGDIFPNHRFLVPAVPALGAALAMALGQLVTELPRRARGATLLVVGAGLLAPVAHTFEVKALATTDRFPQSSATRIAKAAPLWAPHRTPDWGAALAGQLPFAAAWAAVWPAADQTVAFTDIGLLGYATPARLCDLLGLADPVMGRRAPLGPVPAGADPLEVLWTEQRAHVQAHADWIVLSRDSDRWQKLGLDDATAWRPVVDCGTWRVAATAHNTAAPVLPAPGALADRMARLRAGLPDHQDLHVAVVRELVAGGAPTDLVRTHLDWLDARKDAGHTGVIEGLRCDAGLTDGCVPRATSCGAAPPDVRIPR